MSFPHGCLSLLSDARSPVVAMLIAGSVAAGVAGSASAHEGHAAAASHTAQHALSPAPANDEGADEGDESTAHAAEHREIAHEIAAFDRLPAAQKRQVRDRILGQGARAKAQRLSETGTDDVVGKWTSAPFPATDYAINAALLRGGKVLVFSMGSGGGSGGKGRINDGQAAIWDPTLGEGTNAFHEVDPPPMTIDDPRPLPASKDKDVVRPAPIFCAGQVQLADGRVLVAGGNLDQAGLGLKILFLFDPITEKWIREPDMYAARWYPTLTRLPSGHVLIQGGKDESGGAVSSFELYPSAPVPVAGVDANAPLSGLKTSLTPKGKTTYLYPHAFVLADGRMSTSAGGMGRISLYEPTTGRVVDRTNVALATDGSYSTSFLRPGDQNGSTDLVQAGGMTQPATGDPVITNQSWAINPEQETAWRPQPPLNVARRNATAVLLPDATAVVVNGGLSSLRLPITNGSPPMNLAQRQVELWNPSTGVWTLGPPAQIPRGYHSIGLLLADGRVLSAGDDLVSSVLDTNTNDALDSTFEIYSPPYLFKGPRPTIESAPSTAGYGETLTVHASGSRPITRATLVAPGSVTHANDMNQRVLQLPITANSDGSYSVIGPTTSAAAPPGDYMLFVLDDDGVPSIASWIRVRPSYPGQGAPVLATLSGEGQKPTPTPTPTPGDGRTPLDDNTDAPTTATAVATPVPVRPGSDAPTPTPVPAPKPAASKATTPEIRLSGRILHFRVSLAPTGKHCPPMVNVTASVRGVARSGHVKVKSVIADGKRTCAVNGSLTLASKPARHAVVTARITAKGVVALRVRLAAS